MAAWNLCANNCGRKSKHPGGKLCRKCQVAQNPENVAKQRAHALAYHYRNRDECNRRAAEWRKRNKAYTALYDSLRKRP